MERIEAVFADGDFRPLESVSLPENQRVRISVEPIPGPDPLAWLERIRDHHRHVLDRRGPFPDNTTDIAEDRDRDV